MEIEVFLIISFIFIVYGLFSTVIEKGIFTAPLIFMLLGLIFGPQGLNWIKISIENGILRTIAELALVLVLFTDASRIHLTSIKKDHNIPIRLLLIGLPLTMALGILIAPSIFDFLNFWEAAIVAIILAPTDAALSHIVVSSRQIPVRMRQALNIESGLNDGIVLPFVIVVLSFASVIDRAEPISTWALVIFYQFFWGISVGLFIGYFGGKIYQIAYKKKWMNQTFKKISTIALALLAYSLSIFFSGNGFISAFIAGLTIGNASRDICKPLHDFAAVEGRLLGLILFLLFGAIIIGPILHQINWKIALFAFLSLTLIRMLPVAISLIGCHLKWESIIYLGWFGPRGIASIVFGLMVIESSNIVDKEAIFSIVMATVFFSIILHGLSGHIGAKWYEKKVKKMKKGPEQKSVSELPLRYP